MSKYNFRSAGAEDINKVIGNELSDCLWSLLVIAHELDIDLEHTFSLEMDKLETNLQRINRSRQNSLFLKIFCRVITFGVSITAPHITGGFVGV